MTKNDLCVFFHDSAQIISEARLKILGEAMKNAAPEAIAVTTRPGTRSNLSFLFTETLETQDTDSAIEIMKRKSGGRPVAVFTLCEEMMKAADAQSMRVVTIGLPPVTADRQYIAAGPCAISYMFREIRRENN